MSVRPSSFERALGRSRRQLPKLSTWITVLLWIAALAAVVKGDNNSDNTFEISLSQRTVRVVNGIWQFRTDFSPVDAPTVTNLPFTPPLSEDHTVEGMLYVHENSCSQNNSLNQNSNLNDIINQPKIAIIPYDHNCTLFATLTTDLVKRTVGIITYYEPRVKDKISEDTGWVQWEILDNVDEQSGLQQVNLSIPAVAVGTGVGRELIQRVHQANMGLDHYSETAFEMISPSTYDFQSNTPLKVFMVMGMSKTRGGSRLWGLAALGCIVIILVAFVVSGHARLMYNRYLRPTMDLYFGRYTWYTRRFMGTLPDSDANGSLWLTPQQFYESIQGQAAIVSEEYKPVSCNILNGYPTYVLAEEDIARLRCVSQIRSVMALECVDLPLMDEKIDHQDLALSHEHQWSSDPQTPVNNDGIQRQTLATTTAELFHDELSLAETTKESDLESPSLDPPFPLAHRLEKPPPAKVAGVMDNNCIRILKEDGVKMQMMKSEDNPPALSGPQEFVCSQNSTPVMLASNDCSICLEDYKAGAVVRLLPCRHYFHTKCIDLWLTRKSSLCPLCKYNCRPNPYTSAMNAL
ncbi:hypothetical protein IWQ61_006865 [Dispira simplex]|nr:hypothetical protein IWQ61_006865 [Dispira simplex]